MNTNYTITALAAVLTLSASLAQAQPPARPTATNAQQSAMPLGGKLSIGINLGAQTQSSTASSDFSFPLYAQTATVTTTAGISGGPLFDANVGYRFMRNIGVGFGFSSFSSTSTATGAATIPNPIFFDRPAQVTLNPVDAKHTERNVYIVATGYVPLTDTIELSLFVGPSFTHVTQDVITAVTVPPGTQSVVTALGNEAGNAKGVNVGADLSYKFTNLVGAGAFIRYNGGSVDLTTLQNVKAGGLQVGIGARLRF